MRDECFNRCTQRWPPHLYCRCTEIHDPSDPLTCSAQGSTGRLRAYLLEAMTMVNQLSNGQPKTKDPSCMAVLRVIHTQCDPHNSSRACLDLFLVHASTNSTNHVSVERSPDGQEHQRERACGSIEVHACCTTCGVTRASMACAIVRYA